MAFNEETVVVHKKELNKGALVISEKELPMTAWAKEIEAKPILRTAVALGALCTYFGIPLEKLNKIFKKNVSCLNASNLSFGQFVPLSFTSTPKAIKRVCPKEESATSLLIS